MSVKELSHGTLTQILVLLLKFIEAVRVLKSCEHPMRPDVDSGLLDEREGPLSASKTCPLLSGIGAIFLCDNSNVFKADLGRMFFRPDNVGYTRMGEVESALHAINHDVHVEQVHIDCFESCRGLDTTLLHRPPSRQPLPPRPPTSPLPTSPPPLLMFLCVEDLVLTSNVNEWALENNVPLVHATMGPDGLSGLVVTSIRGKTRCLNCYQSSPASSSSSQSPRRTSLDSTFATPLVKKVLPILPASSPCLPMFESIVAGIAAHNALKHLLGFGTVVPCIRYYGLQETIDYSVIPPSSMPRTSDGSNSGTLQCTSPLCREHNHALLATNPRHRKDKSS
ncbi:hypothetical protein DYB37_008847 [Aphanomyces astaci]|uniref:THIF-type NAD/FAD binding fold domain-containing protein n=1 Tax=Aphanomyces astaci TaxID=112090 RepID=A0A3R7AS69_APHAT|nr:hypothetical protein DYB35_006099 [Aphanomyces astaci]RHZ15524.1 hypothetical protein DYB37_008847 [Aphanomyces astaci]